MTLKRLHHTLKLKIPRKWTWPRKHLTFSNSYLRGSRTSRLLGQLVRAVPRDHETMLTQTWRVGEKRSPWRRSPIYSRYPLQRRCSCDLTSASPSPWRILQNVLSGVVKCLPCHPDLCQGSKGINSLGPNRQRSDHDLHQLEGWNTLPPPHPPFLDPPSQDILDLVYGEEDTPSGRAHSRQCQYSCRQGILSNDRSVGLEAPPTNIQQTQQSAGPVPPGWSKLAFANLPWTLIPRVLMEVRRQRANIVLIALSGSCRHGSHPY